MYLYLYMYLRKLQYLMFSRLVAPTGRILCQLVVFEQHLHQGETSRSQEIEKTILRENKQRQQSPKHQE